MSFIKDNFFGGAERRAGDIQAASLEEGQNIVREAAERAEAQAVPLFGAARQNLLAGAQGALDIFGRTAPAQIQAAQGGNLTAQQTLLAGLPQFQNAILGSPVNFGALQAQTQQAPGMDFFQQQLPQFTSSNQVLNPVPQLPMGGPPNLPPILGGGGGIGPQMPTTFGGAGDPGQTPPINPGFFLGGTNAFN